MDKRDFLLSLPLTALLFLAPNTVSAQQNLSELPGLKRFTEPNDLGAASERDIRTIRLGDHVFAATSKLQASGGEVQYISGGKRSRNVKINFSQPYQDAALEQQVKLDFDKHKGFIEHISVRYKLDSAYLDMQPVYTKIIDNTVKKFGEPLDMASVRAQSGKNSGNVLLEDFLESIQIESSVSDDVQAFFNDKIITSRTSFTESSNGRALLTSGFNECYLWADTGYEEILSLCALRKSRVNMKGQTVEMSLHNFSIEDKIENYQAQASDQLNFDL